MISGFAVRDAMRWPILLVCTILLVGCAGFRTGDELQAEIRKHDLFLAPEGAGPFPAVLMLHGCGGLGARDRMWAERLRGWGYVTLRVNSLAPRGLRNVCGGSSLRAEERVPDVLAALVALQGRAPVDPNRIALMGWSHGASATLATLAGAPDTATAQLRAAIAYYPGCRQTASWKARTPVLMLLGGADNWAAPGPCQGLADRQRKAGYDVEQVTYPGAFHGFDNALLGPGARRVPEAMGGRGATMQYDPAAAADSLKRVQDLLSRTLGAARGAS
jgi:dienelactone hydrolase